MAEEKKGEHKEKSEEKRLDGYTKRKVDHKKAEAVIKRERESILQQDLEQKVALSDMGKLSMWLEDYDDLFSDFDPRPYSEKAISDDFISEYQKMLKETKSGELELRFLVPEETRNEKEEEIIKKRLKSYFKTVEKEHRDKLKKINTKGISLVVFGFALMILATFFYMQEDLISRFVVVVIDPAGWFMLWYGLDQLFYNAAEKRKQLVFYEKTSKADIIFAGY